MRKTTHALAIPVALLLAAGVAACGGETPVATSSGSAQETSGGGAASTKPTASGGETASVMDLKVGDCFNRSDSSDQVGTVDVVSCDTPHLYEVYNNSDIDDKKYTTAPTGDDLDTEISDACYDPFQTYVGIDYESSSYKVTAFYPTTSTWVQGDRTINCLITSQDDKPLTGSARNSRK
mgnify:CR=1 FL=1